MQFLRAFQYLTVQNVTKKSFENLYKKFEKKTSKQETNFQEMKGFQKVFQSVYLDLKFYNC